MGEQKDTEIVLGTGKLLAIFFALAAMCGTFFGLGYSLGRSSGPMAIQSEESARLVSSPGAKPAAGVTVTTPPASDVTAAPAANPASAQADPAPSVNDAASEDASPAPAGMLKPAAIPPSASAVKTPELASASGNITVQVAAVTKQEDAQALVAALKRKNYPVFVLPQSSADSLYHVQVGPFAELKDAEAMRSKLAGDGYNAIVKK
jgi:cell division septation protein DedD